MACAVVCEAPGHTVPMLPYVASRLCPAAIVISLRAGCVSYPLQQQDQGMTHTRP